MSANMTLTGTQKLADPHAPVRITVPAGVALAIGDVCYIDASGVALKAVSTQCTIANTSCFAGICLSVAAIGEPVTLFGIGTKIYVSDTVQTIGSFWWVSATAGALYNAKVATADTALPVGKMITAHVMEIVRGGV